jgi:hypothetical protein
MGGGGDQVQPDERRAVFAENRHCSSESSGMARRGMAAIGVIILKRDQGHKYRTVRFLKDQIRQSRVMLLNGGRHLIEGSAGDLYVLGSDRETR